jgi:cob(I)alamin adenosyltransferase
MKIYTKTGDEGETGLFGGGRVRKDDLRIEAYGSIDELNALLGAARADSPPAELDAPLARIQSQLFDFGAELATPDADNHHLATLGEPHIRELEREIDAWEAQLAPLRQFILPGGIPLAAQLHVARTVCRRAERRLMTFAARTPVRAELVRYLNRLSDWLFVAARRANQLADQADVPWVKLAPPKG